MSSRLPTWNAATNGRTPQTSCSWRATRSSGVRVAERLQRTPLGILEGIGLGFLDDPCHGLDHLYRVLAGGGLAREHEGVGAVENGIGHVSRLGAGGPRLLDH